MIFFVRLCTFSFYAAKSEVFSKGNLSRGKVYVLINHVRIISEKHFCRLLFEVLFLELGVGAYLDGRENTQKKLHLQSHFLIRS